MIVSFRSWSTFSRSLDRPIYDAKRMPTAYIGPEPCSTALEVCGGGTQRHGSLSGERESEKKDMRADHFARLAFSVPVVRRGNHVSLPTRQSPPRVFGGRFAGRAHGPTEFCSKREEIESWRISPESGTTSAATGTGLADAAGRENEWARRVSEALRGLLQALRRHAAEADSQDGPMTEVDQTRPTLARQVTELREEHARPP